MKNFIAMIIATGFLSACTTGEKHTSSIIGGGVVGGITGSVITGGNPVGAAAGAVGGALIGNRLAK
jgi:hypothetical protein